MEQSAAIIAIGSEILSGQTVDRNSAWLANQLLEIGIPVWLHSTVDDVEDHIRAAISNASENCSLIFTTGGLGPTRDDITRNAIGRLAKRPLAFDAASWQQIVDIFQGLGRTVPEANRQQCFFPEGSRIFKNSAGTANGFATTLRDLTIVALPGPPREIHALWDGIREFLEGQLSMAIPRLLSRKWRTIGIGESHLTEFTEPILSSVSDSELKVAYRAHAPFIETKILYPRRLNEQMALVENRLDHALARWLFESDEQNHVLTLEEKLASYKNVCVMDRATDGRLGSYWQERVSQARFDNVALICDRGQLEPPVLSSGQPFDAIFTVEFVNPFQKWRCSLTAPDSLPKIRYDFEEGRDVPFPQAMRRRNQLAIAALASKAWTELLR